MQDLAFEAYLDKVADLLKTAAEIGLDLDEVLDHLSKHGSEGTQGT